MKTISDPLEFCKSEIEPLVDHVSLTAYERLNNAEAISLSLYTHGNESVLVRNSYYWKKDGEVIADAPHSMSMRQVCRMHGWRIVECYGEHLAIISPK